MEAVPRSVPVRRRDGAGNLRPHRGDRSRHALGLCHTLGPFELWDALGFRRRRSASRREGRALPAECRDACWRRARHRSIEAADRDRQPAHAILRSERDDATASSKPRPGIMVLADIKRARGVVKKNAGASLVDLGDGVLCLEFHSKMNSLGDDTVAMMHAGIEETDAQFRGDGHRQPGREFQRRREPDAGPAGRAGRRMGRADAAVRRFQHANMAIKYAPKPVVAAPFGMTLGGGCEFALHAARVQASAEPYMGLVEVGVGLIPAGGGCKEMLLRLGDPQAGFRADRLSRKSRRARRRARTGLAASRRTASR